MISEELVCKKIKELRVIKNMTLEELAKKTELSKSYLSRVENSKKAPPVSTLIRIAKALKASLSEILGEKKTTDYVSVVKKDERFGMSRPGSVFGYYYESLVRDYASIKMHAYLMTKPLHPKKQGVFKHDGEEMIFMLEGKMKYHVGEKEFLLEEGDCIHFDSGYEHYGTVIGDKDVKTLLIILSDGNHGE